MLPCESEKSPANERYRHLQSGGLFGGAIPAIVVITTWLAADEASNNSEQKARFIGGRVACSALFADLA
jgi:hypothetical protein